ncbi:MAG: Flp family type IVb pilin [Micavibrio sp.]|nr:Flp family type IVb pilin [Micavibrio sp.]|tara:strand:- start:2212 stop:2424 length:213 start_codon:yes stop_codon:yes gene_type:complete
MKKLLAWKEAYLQNEDGATAIEYGLIAAGIALAIAASVFAFGGDLATMFSSMETNIGAAATATSAMDQVQ